MSFILRPETPEDHRAVERLTKEAFLPVQLPGRTVTDEHLLAHKLRKSDAFVPELDYVAAEVREDGSWSEVVGSILYSRAKVVNAEGKAFTVLTFGPLSVKPSWQKQGVGAALIRHTANEAKHLRYRAILIFGHPGYYPRFGFRPAAEFGITAADGQEYDALMAYECLPGSLQGVSGKLELAPVYTELDPAELTEFEAYLEEHLDTP